MDEGEKRELNELLEENTKIARENHRLLKKIHRSLQWGSFFRLVYWAVILISIFGVYYFIQPLIDSFGANLDTVRSGFNTLQQVGEIDISEILGR